MKLKNAIKKLEKFGEVQVNGSEYSVVKDGREVSFMVNGRIEDDLNIMCIRGRGVNDHDDSMTDYCAGVWYDNLTQATKRWTEGN